MTQDANFKRRIRQRSGKTGESYTAARHQLLKQTQIQRLQLLSQDREFMWLEDPNAHPYIRAVCFVSSSRTRRPSIKGINAKALVGYSILKPDALPIEGSDRLGRRRWERRLFYVAAWDRSYEPDGTYAYIAPSGAVILGKSERKSRQVARAV